MTETTGIASETERPSANVPTIDNVKAFWEDHPCGHETGAARDGLEYFLQVERYRYENAPFIPEIARFHAFSGQRVLEVGCGIGTDGARFVREGARYVGLDLTTAAVDLARRNFTARGISGEFVAADAEHLPFSDAEFDHVYSFGVIHHTANPRAIVNEIFRVLRPGGTLTVMIYNRSSINYYVEIMFLRKIGRRLLRPSWAPGMLSRVLRLPREKLEGHRTNLLRIPHPTEEQWISMNTDGPDCPLARVYSAGEADALFTGFEDVWMEVHGFDRSHWPVIGRLMSDGAAERIGRRWGWHRVVHARKPLASPQDGPAQPS